MQVVREAIAVVIASVRALASICPLVVLQIGMCKVDATSARLSAQGLTSEISRV
jgi:hypothetical protein